MQRQHTTRTNRTARLVTSVALAGAVLLGACGSDDDEPAAEPAAEEPADDSSSDSNSDSGDDSSSDTGDGDAGAAGDATSGGDASVEGAAELGQEVADDILGAVDEAFTRFAQPDELAPAEPPPRPERRQGPARGSRGGQRRRGGDGSEEVEARRRLPWQETEGLRGALEDNLNSI